MNRHITYLLTAVLALGAASCSSSRRAYNNDDIYYKQMSDPKGRNTAKATKNSGKKPKVKGNACQQALIDEAYTWLGVPYASGGKTKNGTDCSGFIMEVYRRAVGIDLPRNSAAQSDACRQIKKSQLNVGDLVFFHPSKKGRISHVGMYVGNNKMIHASSHGVMVSDLSEVYYQRCYSHCGRVPAIDKLLKGEY